MENIKFEKLNGNNYLNWAFRMKILMQAKSVWSAIEPGLQEVTSNEQTQTDRNAMSIICNTVENSQLMYIRDAPTAKVAWMSLKKAYTTIGLIHVIHLKRELYASRLKPEESMNHYFDRMSEMALKLDAAGYGLSDEEFAHILLTGLPDDYDTLVVGIEASGSVTVSKVKTFLINEESRRTKRNTSNDTIQLSPAANRISNGNMPKYIPSNENTTKHIPKCHFCGKLGHIARNCFKKKEMHQRGIKENQNNACSKFAFGVKMYGDKCFNISNNSSNSLKWCLDSGATDHMTSNQNIMKNVQPVKSFSVKVANGENIDVTAKGDVNLYTSFDAVNHEIELKNTLFLPGLDGNLLSVNRIVEKGYTVNFDSRYAKVMDNKNKVLLKAYRENGLYVVNMEKEKHYIKNSIVNLATKKENIFIWHDRFGHLNFNSLKKLQSKCMVRGLLFENKMLQNYVCSTCISEKQTRTLFPKQSLSRSNELLQIIHTDICGPISPMSLGNNRYFVTFIDDFSRFVTIYFMKKKSEALECFKDYKKRAELELNKKIKCLRSDNGTENINKNFNDFLNEHGIKRQLTVTYSPQQNGIAERANRTLVETARCLLEKSGLPKKFWGEALATAVHIRNRCPTKILEDKVPASLWYNRIPSVTYFKTFGCKCWSLIKEPGQRRKFDSKSYPCIFIGYAVCQKGYRVWNIKKGTIEISRDLRFDESEFPYKQENYLESKEEENLYVSFNDIMQENENGEEIISENTSKIKLSGGHSTELNEDDSGTISMIENPRRSKRIKEIGMNKTAKQTITLEYNEDENPKKYNEIIHRKDSEKWLDSMNEEINSLRKNGTWLLVEPPKNRNVIGSKWVYTRKFTKNGEIDRYKARLVAQGYAQIPGIDYLEIFSPVVKWKSLRILLALAAEHNWCIHQMDVKTAYLNGTLKEEIYMAQPPGFIKKGEEHLVCLLKKSLYGLKQSGREWNHCLDEYLRTLNFTSLQTDPCVYITYINDRVLIVTVYVDDLLIFGKDINDIENLKKKLNERFEMKDMKEASYLLGVEISRNTEKNEISINQRNYIEKILKRFGMEQCKPISTPLDTNFKLTKEFCPESEEEKSEMKKYPYRELIGSLMYLATTTRPDLIFPVTFLSQFNINPGLEHWRAAKRVLRYLQNTKYLGISFMKNQTKLAGYADADWASSLDDRRSYTGYLFTLANGAISWETHKQETVALSTAEAEFMALTSACKENIWLTMFLKELKMEIFLPELPVIFTDNQSAKAIAENPIYHSRTKHIDIKFHFIREEIMNKNMRVEYLPSEIMPADLLTKSLNGPRMKKLICLFGLKDQYSID